MEPLRVFIGYDHRQAISLHVLIQSIYENAKKPVSVTPLVISTLPIQSVGLTPFTYSRFLAPYLCGYKGWSLFLDADMLVEGDISEIFDCKNPDKAIHVVKGIKKFEWASVMLFNNEKCKMLTPEFIDQKGNLLTLSFLKDEEIGDLPSEWNHLVGYDSPREDPKLIHYTQGVPFFAETIKSEHAEKWQKIAAMMNSAMPWGVLMAKSVHAQDYKGYRLPKYLFDEVTGEPKEEHKKWVETLLDPDALREAINGNLSSAQEQH